MKRQGTQAIENWIDRQMKHKRAVVVLVGAETANRPWVNYEIRKAWNEYYPLVGVRIHGMADRFGNLDRLGVNPFTQVPLQGGGTVADYVKLHEPTGFTTQQIYGSIMVNLESWVASAVRR